MFTKVSILTVILSHTLVEGAVILFVEKYSNYAYSFRFRLVIINSVNDTLRELTVQLIVSII